MSDVTTADGAERGELLWEPSPEAIDRSNMTRYMRWLEAERGLRFGGDYHALWRWSVAELEDFWESIWEFFDVRASAPYDQVLGLREMPGAQSVPRRPAQLRREPAGRQAGRTARDPARIGAARARLADLG